MIGYFLILFPLFLGYFHNYFTLSVYKYYLHGLIILTTKTQHRIEPTWQALKGIGEKGEKGEKWG